MSVALLREGGKYYRKCKLFKRFRDVSEMPIFGCHRKLNTGKNELTNSLLKNWNSFDRYAGCFNFVFSSGCHKTVHKLTNE